MCGKSDIYDENINNNRSLKVLDYVELFNIHI